MNLDQVWLFLYERIDSIAYRLESRTIGEVSEVGFIFRAILEILWLDESLEYSFYITSDYIRKAVPLLHEESIFLMAETYCKNDPVVTIIIRPPRDPSPNHSQTPSGIKSLLERRELSAHKELQNVVVRNQHGGHLTMDSVHVLGHILEDVCLTKWSEVCQRAYNRSQHLKWLCHKYPYFENNAHALVQDLVHYTDPAHEKAATASIASISCPYVLGPPYFSSEAVEDILLIPMGNSMTLQDHLDAMVMDAVEQNSVICPSCNLAPVFLCAFGLVYSEDEESGRFDIKEICDQENTQWSLRTLKRQFVRTGLKHLKPQQPPKKKRLCMD
ncbi:hypothetical protein N7462_006513 [Penicillium macrosclerotiorum]|uniref:uncharacterized protein n=1 Tax=Penicillium macrosclerotiorum TaxID=303699 RepID=UPI002548AC76|nr:uncharacterized protein N7462_006513 [Penicillium macrosclerotiorum]KAJ5683348.1 hypothetical protein N7462_006513 [Penicillium macrosclerotiorum]